MGTDSWGGQDRTGKGQNRTAATERTGLDTTGQKCYDRTGLAKYRTGLQLRPRGLDWLRQDRTGYDRTGLDATGQDLIRQDRTGYDRTGLVTKGQDWLRQERT